VSARRAFDQRRAQRRRNATSISGFELSLRWADKPDSDSTTPDVRIALALPATVAPTLALASAEEATTKPSDDVGNVAPAADIEILVDWHSGGGGADGIAELSVSRAKTLGDALGSLPDATRAAIEDVVTVSPSALARASLDAGTLDALGLGSGGGVLPEVGRRD
jgi:hypothetical protein